MDADLSLVLGVDGGASNTVCCALNLGTRAVKHCVGKSCNRNSVGEQQALTNLFTALEDTLASVHADWSAVSAISLGMSGVDTLSDVTEYTSLIRERLRERDAPPHVRVYVASDAVTALTSGTRGSPTGIALIAGTGSIAYGSHQGKQGRAGGWGAAFMDGGCGYDIGQRAIASAARGADGRDEATMLCSALTRHVGAADMQGLLRWVYRDTAWSRLASLAPVVIECAEAGDAVAQSILETGVRDLVDIVNAVLVQLGVSGASMDGGDTRLPLVLSGGLLTSDNLYSTMVQAGLRRGCPSLNICMPEVDAAQGAALLGEHYMRNNTADSHPDVLRGVLDDLPWTDTSPSLQIITTSGLVGTTIPLLNTASIGGSDRKPPSKTSAEESQQHPAKQ